MELKSFSGQKLIYRFCKAFCSVLEDHKIIPSSLCKYLNSAFYRKEFFFFHPSSRLGVLRMILVEVPCWFKSNQGIKNSSEDAVSHGSPVWCSGYVYFWWAGCLQSNSWCIGHRILASHVKNQKEKAWNSLHGWQRISCELNTNESIFVVIFFKKYLPFLNVLSVGFFGSGKQLIHEGLLAGWRCHCFGLQYQQSCWNCACLLTCCVGATFLKLSFRQIWALRDGLECEMGPLWSGGSVWGQLVNLCPLNGLPESGGSSKVPWVRGLSVKPRPHYFHIISEFLIFFCVSVFVL